MCLETAWKAIQAGKLAPTEKNEDNGKKQKNEDLEPWASRLSYLEMGDDLFPASSRTTPIWSHHRRMSSWPQSKLGYLGGFTRDVETTQRGTRTNTVGSTNM